MKRTSAGDAVDVDHPALAFHREVLLIQAWTHIRRAFLEALEAAARKGVVQWREPRKLWRHAQEALGKWILSQVARVHTAGSGSTRASSCSAAPVSEADIHFFPTEAQLRCAAAAMATPSPHMNSSSATLVAAVAESSTAPLTTYDAQLIRDLSLKSNGTHDASVVAALAALVAGFSLPRRCAQAAAEVVANMQGVRPAQALRPRLRRIEEKDAQRTAAQRRIAGPIAEVSVQWPSHWHKEQCRDCPAVSLPWAAVHKLRLCYQHFAEEEEKARYDVSKSPEEAERRFELRAATVILRYEGGLATGSLQLCADTRLKQHLHAAGYHVMDLCASPINAYMGVAQHGSFASPAKEETSGPEVANRFCSAFYDTDQYFGSMGSAVAVDSLEMYASANINPTGQPLLLTLDVPYDEDLCELLFQKLVKDMRRAASLAATAAKVPVVDYVLVVPLWWDIQMKIEKRLFAEGTVTTSSAVAGAKDGSSSPDTPVALLIQERAAMLRVGYQVPYTWPSALAEAAGDATVPHHKASSSNAPWVCFDGVFVDDRYGYFCTATNRWLHGVTTTEVIGLAQPRVANASDDGETPAPLQRALDEFYGVVPAS